MLEIKILGMGCTKCHKLEATVMESLQHTGLTGVVLKVTDPITMADMGVMHTPALVVNGVVKSSGRLPTREQVDAWVTEAEPPKG